MLAQIRSAFLLKKLGRLTIAPVSQVRWRKARDKPRAKSKFFVVREQTPKDPAEWEMLKFHTDIYRTKMKSIVELFKTKLQEDGESGEKSLQQFQKEAEEHKELMKINDKWNEEIRISREVRLAKEIINHRIKAAEFVNSREKLKLEGLIEKEGIVKDIEERTKSFITEETLDDEIEKLLNSTPKNYNYALEPDGNIKEPKLDEAKNSEQPT